MTEEQMGGTAPEPGADALAADQASEEAVAAVAVADEPAETTQPNQTSQADDVDIQREPPAPAADVEPIAGVLDGTLPAETQAQASEATAEPEASAAAEASSTLGFRPEQGTAAALEAPAEPEASAAAEGTAEAEAAVEAAPVAEEPVSTSASEAISDADMAAAPAASEEDEPVAAPAPAGPEPSTMEELLAEQDADIRSFKHGDVVEGQVVRIDRDEILVDIGAKSEGVVSNRELYGRHAESQPQLSIGDTVLVYVLQPESQEGHVVLSLRRAGLERKWRSMQEQFEAGVIIEAPVIDHNKGGLIVDCGIRGFVPISQIVDFPRRPQNDQPRDAAQEIAEKLQPYVGRKLRLKILEVNRKANRLILSEKVALYEERREKRDELFSSLQVGQKVTGTVRSIAPFGVFVDLGGIDGLVHKSELSWNKVNNPEAGYKVGDEVEAEVIDINHERGRISLSIRRLQPDPWHSTVADFKVGDIIDGTVTKLVNFGAFVRVRDGLEGLIHISELSHQRVAHPGDVVHEGQQLKLKIISLESERHRLGLSLKQAEEPPARPTAEPRERRPRPERSYSMADAVQEPEGGIDNTLAAAFAQVRQQMAEAESSRQDEPAAGALAPALEPETTASEPGTGASEPETGASAPEAEPEDSALETAQPVEAAQAAETDSSDEPETEAKAAAEVAATDDDLAVPEADVATLDTDVVAPEAIEASAAADSQEPDVPNASEGDAEDGTETAEPEGSGKA